MPGGLNPLDQGLPGSSDGNLRAQRSAWRPEGTWQVFAESLGKPTQDPPGTETGVLIT